MTGIENEPHILHAPPVVKILGDRERGEQLRGRALQLLRITKDQNFQGLPVWQMTYHQDPLTGEMAAPGPGTDVFVCSVAHGQEQVIVQAAAVGEVKEAPEDRPLIEPDEPRPEEEAQDFLVFYKHEGITKLAVFNITTESVIRKLTRLGYADTAVLTRKDTGKTTRFFGVTGPLVVFEKELSGDGAGKVLWGIPFTHLGDSMFSYNGFEFYYTDPFSAHYKIFDTNMDNVRRGRISYGIYNRKDGEYNQYSRGGHINCGGGFAYDRSGRVLLYTLDDAEIRYEDAFFPGFTMDFLYGIFGVTEINISDGSILRSTTYAGKDKFCFLDTSGNALRLEMDMQLGDVMSGALPDGSYLEAVGSRTALVLRHETNRHQSPIYRDKVYTFIHERKFITGAVACDISIESGLSWYGGSHYISIDGRLLRTLTQAETGSGPYTGGRDRWGGFWVTENVFSGDRSIEYTYAGGTTTSPLPVSKRMTYNYELEGSLCVGFFNVDSYYTGDGQNIIIITRNGDVIRTGEHIRNSYSATGLVPHIFGLPFPVGLNENDSFALITQSEFDYSGPILVINKSEIAKTLLTPYEEIPIETPCRPVGWMQIHTKENKHILQGVLIIGDETGEVWDARIWHNRQRIDDTLAAALGVSIKDVYGIMYLPGTATAV